MYLDEQELFDLRRSLETIRDIVRFLEKEDMEEEDSPTLAFGISPKISWHSRN